MVDAGVSEPERARALLDLGVDRVVVRTKTLADADALAGVPDAGAGMDLRHARVLQRRGAQLAVCRRLTQSLACRLGAAPR